MKRFRFYITFLIATIVVFAFELVTFIYYINSTSELSIAYIVTFILILSILGIVVVGFTSYAYLVSRSRNISKIQNFYNLNRTLDVNRLNEFLEAVNPRYIRNKKQAYIISFCPFSETTLSDINHAPATLEFYGFFVDYITAYFKKNKNFKRHQYEFCYTDNTFLLYLVGDYELVEKIVNDFEGEVYDIEQKHDLRLFVQPFFGIYRIEKDTYKKLDLRKEIKDTRNAVHKKLKDEKLLLKQKKNDKKIDKDKNVSEQTKNAAKENEAELSKETAAEEVVIKEKIEETKKEENNKDVVSLFDAINFATIARRYGQNNYETSIIYTPDMSKNGRANSDKEISNIIEGLKKGEFVVYYQPKFHLKTKKFVGSEALIRWDSPTFGLVSPIRFISVAEHSGIIHEIDMYVLESVCKDIADWKNRGHEILPVSVNFSLFEFYTPTFLDDIKNIINKYKVNPMYIEMEITEQTNSANSFLIISLLKKIKEMNIKILMDDFGVGFSNINNLKKLPIDIVKLDKSFNDDIVVDVKAREIDRTIISFCHTLNLTVIAEGVDTEEKVNVLKNLNCDIIQGYYYSPAIPKKEYERFLANNKFEKKGKE
ncbi:MAG: EAL domain-containing protein [Bacilli bacterium]